MENAGIGFVIGAWFALAFLALQVLERRHVRSAIAMCTALAVGVALLAIRDGAVGFGWLRSESLRSDALALGSFVPMLAVNSAVLADREVRASSWGSITAAACCASCIGAAGVALVLGRSSWYWEFVALVGAGMLLGAVGAVGVLTRDASTNARIVWGTAGAAGAFIVIAGMLLLLAWRALELQ